MTAVAPNTVLVACAADRNFIRFAPTMINSVLSNTSRKVVFGVFTQNVDARYQDRLRAMFPGVEILFWEIPSDSFDGMTYKAALSPMVYARALMAELSGWDKFLYLDLDISVTGDVGELFDTDLGDNYIGSCLYSGRINSGVLLINGALWRKHGVQEQVLHYAAENKPKEADQASIEAVCQGRILALPRKWNVIVDPIWGRQSTLQPEYYRNAAITHYITGFKPWNLGYYLLPKELRVRWSQYRLKGRFPVSRRRELKIFVYQSGMLFKEFVIRPLRSRRKSAKASATHL